MWEVLRGQEANIEMFQWPSAHPQSVYEKLVEKSSMSRLILIQSTWLVPKGWVNLIFTCVSHKIKCTQFECDFSLSVSHSNPQMANFAQFPLSGTLVNWWKSFFDTSPQFSHVETISLDCFLIFFPSYPYILFSHYTNTSIETLGTK